MHSKSLEDYFPPIVVKDFTDEAVERFRNQVYQEAIIDEESPIQIMIDSYGGNVDAMASMIEILESVPNPIETVCIGKAMSAGAFLLSFGETRYCGKHSLIMIHEISAGSFGHVQDIINEAREFKRANQYWMTRLAENCGLKDYMAIKKKMREKSARDLYLDAQQAKELGLVHHIGIPKFTPKLRNPKRRTKR